MAYNYVIVVSQSFLFITETDIQVDEPADGHKKYWEACTSKTKKFKVQ